MVLALIVMMLGIGGCALRARFRKTKGRWYLLWQRISFRTKLRVAISFVQVATQLERVYDLRYPEAFSKLLDYLSIINLDVTGWLQLHPTCIGLGQLEARLYFFAFVPLGVVCTVAPLTAKLCNRPLLSALPFVLGWTFLLFPVITSFAFRSLAQCECFDYVGDGKVCFLREDYEVICTGSPFGYTAAPPPVLAAAWTCVGVWAIGVPLTYALLIKLLDRGLGRAALGILLDDYRPQVRGWELVIVGEKLLLTGFLALFHPGSWLQLFFGTVVTLFAFVLQSRMNPYQTATDNLLAYVTALSLLAVFLGSLGIQTNALGIEINLTALVALLFIFTLLVLVATLLFFIVEIRTAPKVLRLKATGNIPSLTLASGKKWHLFISHNCTLPVCMKPLSRVTTSSDCLPKLN